MNAASQHVAIQVVGDSEDENASRVYTVGIQKAGAAKPGTKAEVQQGKALPEELQGWVELPGARAPRPGVGSEPEYFVRCLLEGTAPEGAVSLRGARATQEVIEAVYRSAETGQVVKLPL